ncbi:MAG: toprim domain-containing protein, partial [Planctomycetota bacterium]
SKMMLGPCAQGAVRLAPAGDELVLTEGIETALSILQATGKPTWACLSTSGLKTVILPPEVATVTIAADGDEPGLKAAEKAAARFCHEGREVKIARPPAGYDFNDLLMKPENVIPFPGHREAANG